MGKCYPSREYEPRICKCCGATFTPKHGKAVYCSADCQRLINQERRRVKMARGRPIYEKVCKSCGNKFTTTKAHAVYCSNDCRSYIQKKPKPTKRFVCTVKMQRGKRLCPNPKCSWRIDCGTASVCARAVCPYIVKKETDSDECSQERPS